MAYQAVCSSVDWTQTQVGRQDLPDDLGLEPDIRLGAADFDIASDHLELEWFEELVKLREDLFREPSADLAYRLEMLRVRVVACQQERAVDGRPLAFTVICANNDQVKRVSDTRQIVLL